MLPTSAPCDPSASQATRSDQPALFSVGRLARPYRTSQVAGIRRTGGMVKGDTQMKQVRRLLVRALVCALLLLSLSASVASADSGPAGGSSAASTQDYLIPEDPGFPQ